MNYTPSKIELRLIQYVYKNGKEHNGMRAYDLTQALEKIKLSTNDIIYFQLQTPLLRFDGQYVFMTNEGNVFMENKNYTKAKEVAFWIFGIGSIIAAIFAIVSVL